MLSLLTNSRYLRSSKYADYHSIFFRCRDFCRRRQSLHSTFCDLNSAVFFTTWLLHVLVGCTFTTSASLAYIFYVVSKCSTSFFSLSALDIYFTSSYIAILFIPFICTHNIQPGYVHDVNMSKKQWRLKPSGHKTVLATIHINNGEAKRELQVDINVWRLPFNGGRLPKAHTMRDERFEARSWHGLHRCNRLRSQCTNVENINHSTAEYCVILVMSVRWVLWMSAPIQPFEP